MRIIYDLSVSHFISKMVHLLIQILKHTMNIYSPSLRGFKKKKNSKGLFAFLSPLDEHSIIFAPALFMTGPFYFTIAPLEIHANNTSEVKIFSVSKEHVKYE